MRSTLRSIAGLDPEERKAFLANLETDLRYRVLRELTDWREWARPKQLPPPGDWNVWAITSGRGFGKTRTGSEFVRAEVAAGRANHIAFVERTPGHARESMLDGRSGMLKVGLPHERPTYEPTRRRLVWPNGAIGHVYTAAEPDDLRAFEGDLAWCEELASWKYPREAWGNLQFGMRAGTHPRTIITTTPKPLSLLAEILARSDCVHVTGSTYENRANLSAPFLAMIESEYEGTHLAAQEIHGRILDAMPGALWTRALLDQTRVAIAPEFARILIGIDPAITSTAKSDKTGIVACGFTAGSQPHGYAVVDRSGRYTPDGWGRAGVKLFRELDADRIIAESNQGGEMVRHVIESVRPKDDEHGVSDGLDGRGIPIVLRHASRAKIIRAEPVAMKFEQGLAHIVGVLPDLETELCTWEPIGGRKSPDRLDAMVHALREGLVVGRSKWADAGYDESDPEIEGALKEAGADSLEDFEDLLEDAGI